MTNSFVAQMERLHQDTKYYNEMPLDYSFQPLSLTIATLFEDSVTGTPAWLRLDLLDRMDVDEYIEYFSKEDIYEVLRHTLVNLKLNRSLLTICHQHLTQKVVLLLQ